MNQQFKPEDLAARSSPALVVAIQRQVRALQSSTGMSDAEVARRADTSGSTFSEFMRSTYKGNMIAIAEKLQKWLAQEDASLESRSSQLASPGFVETSIARQIIQALTFAQTKPSLALITVGSGLGKTISLKQFQASRLHAWRVPIEPIEGKPAAALRKIARVIGLVEPKTNLELTARLQERLRGDQGRQPLLMIDEAQNLTDAAVNQLRFILDEAGCGLALAGNEDLMTRYSMGATREGYGQIHRRIGLRVHVKAAKSSDADMILDAMAVTDADIRRLGRQIVTRTGGYGQLVETLQLASTLAYGARVEISADHVRSAWQNRAGEELGR